LNEPLSILTDWKITNWPTYLLVVLGAGFAIRFVTSLLKALEYRHREVVRPGILFRKIWCDAFRGRGLNPDKYDDLCFPAYLGILELFAFPILITTNNTTFIGAWLTFKTIAEAVAWKNYRSSFTRFLIGNALVLIAATAIARCFFTA